MPAPGRFLVGKHQLKMAALIISGQRVLSCKLIGCCVDTFSHLCAQSELAQFLPGIWVATPQTIAWADRVVAHKASVRHRPDNESAYQRRKMRCLETSK